MDLTGLVAVVVAVCAALVAIAAAVLSLLAIQRQRRVKRAYLLFSQGSREDVLDLLQRYINEVGELRADVAAAQANAEGLRRIAADCLSRVASVSYDAFDDVGGQFSYSTALLDGHGDGVVLTFLHGRTEALSYAKPVHAGRSSHYLSAEEAKVVQEALDIEPGMASRSTSSSTSDGWERGTA